VHIRRWVSRLWREEGLGRETARGRCERFRENSSRTEPERRWECSAASCESESGREETDLVDQIVRAHLSDAVLRARGGSRREVAGTGAHEGPGGHHGSERGELGARGVDGKGI
jgi:hypothetical protein